MGEGAETKKLKGYLQLNFFQQKLTQQQINSILIGNLLGDGSYDNRGGILKNRHNNKQNSYVYLLENLYKEMGVFHSSKYDYLSPTNINPHSKSSYVKGKVPNKAFFENECFFEYNNSNLTKSGNITYYKKHKRVVSEFALNNIDPLGLLLWFLDDGSLAAQKRTRKTKISVRHWYERHATLSTHGFSYDEHLIIQDVFQKRFGIQVKLYKQKSRYPGTKTISSINYYTYFNADNFRKFYDIVRPWLFIVPANFSYKFNMKYETTGKNRILSKNYNFSL